MYVVLMSPFLASRLFLNAERLGMKSKGYAWITTDTITDFMNSMDPSVIESMQEVLGFKPHIPASKELREFAIRWSKNLNENQDLQEMELNVYGIYTYDMVQALATASESMMIRHRNIIHQETGLNMNFTTIRSSQSGLVFIERIIGYWNPKIRITPIMKEDRTETNTTLSSKLKSVIWPGGTKNIPKDYEVHYDFIPFEDANGQMAGSHKDLLLQVYHKNYDAVVGDVTIFSERFFIFRLHIAIHGLRHWNRGAENQQKQFIIRANRNDLLVLILISGLCSQGDAVEQLIEIELNSKVGYVGYHYVSVLGTISNLNFENPLEKPYNSPEEYANALRRGSEKGGVSAIIVEIPYLKAFPKGSPLVQDISGAITRLREEGKLQKMENECSTHTPISETSKHNDQQLEILSQQYHRLCKRLLQSSEISWYK
ncbi:hypothetical protein F3Y22_tig00002919pilonHSYRG00170 [Hibiscus syriacus]|uniref:Receptor ligand binding region domain-containing protein n=1 Tax=Hibiscus syriacus TaxID=106335 RepID=A0A6A3CNZ5_HIBSY|nr:hypothetical protein F3Y22_tig00002919pilonHSYRG00170 [Hibiscus syriacus]